MYIRLAILLTILASVTGAGFYISSVIEDNKQLELQLAKQAITIETMQAVSERQKKATALNDELSKAVANLQGKNYVLETKLSSKAKYARADKEVLTRAINIGTIRVLRDIHQASSGTVRNTVSKSANTDKNSK